MITSRQNQQVKDWAKLSSKKERLLKQEFLVEGEHLVKEAFLANRLKKVIYSQEYKGSFKFESYETVSKEVAQKLSSTQSVSDIFGLVSLVDQSVEGTKWVYLDDIQDPGNIGTLIRSATSFGFDTFLYSPRCADVYSDKVLRSAQGAHFHIQLKEVESQDLIDIVQAHQLKLVTTYLHSDLEIKHEMPKENFCLCLGNEGSGLSDVFKPYSDLNVLVKMSAFESLNVGVAGSILMYLSQ